MCDEKKRRPTELKDWRENRTEKDTEGSRSRRGSYSFYCISYTAKKCHEPHTACSWHVGMHIRGEWERSLEAGEILICLCRIK